MRGTKLLYQYTDGNGVTHLIYARNLAEAQKLAPSGAAVARKLYEGA